MLLGHRGSTHKIFLFLPMKSVYKMNRYVQLYIDEIRRLHGGPVSIVSGQKSCLTSWFWKCLYEGLGIKLQFSTIFYLQTNSQSERMIQTLKDMCELGIGFQRLLENNIYL